MSVSVSGGAVKPNTLIFHNCGRLSVRVSGSWRRKIAQVTGPEYLALLREDRERIILREFETGRSLIEGHEPIVARPL
jgi:hypothetical protein